MNEWRNQALRQMPSLTKVFRRRMDPMELWVYVHSAFVDLYDKPLAHCDAIRQVYQYASWCYFRSGDHDVSSAAACAFYEHLALDENVRRDVPNHLSREEFRLLEEVFRYHLDEAELDAFRREQTQQDPGNLQSQDV